MTTHNIAVLYEAACPLEICQQLASQLAAPVVDRAQAMQAPAGTFFLTWREAALCLVDASSLKKGGLCVDIMPRAGEARCYPAPKDGALAQAIGRKTKSVVDATAGWGQDGLALFRMGYKVTFIERSPVMAALLADGLQRLNAQSWLEKHQRSAPTLLQGNAIELLAQLTSPPECIYLDPMFAPKRKKSALAKKAMQVLHEIIGQDSDKHALFAAAWAATSKRVVVKSPDYAPALAGKPSESFAGKLVRYDVYLKG